MTNPYLNAEVWQKVPDENFKHWLGEWVPSNSSVIFNNGIDEGLEQAATRLETIEKSQEALEHALGTMRAMARKTAASIKEIPLTERPATIAVSFGLKLTAEGGAVLAKAGVEAGITVTMTWQKRRQPSRNRAGNSIRPGSVHKLRLLSCLAKNPGPVPNTAFENGSSWLLRSSE